MNKTVTLLSAVLAASVLCVVFLSAFDMVAFNDMDYYGYEFEKNKTAEATGYGMPALEREAQTLIEYMKDGGKAVSAFENSNFFNGREKLHMRDVREIVRAAVCLRRFCAAVSAAALLVLSAVKADMKNVLFAFYKVFGMFLAVLSVFCVFAVTDFSGVFTAFHEVFFSNDLWLFDPAKSVLINMVPEGFFIDTVFRVCVVLYSVCGAVFIYGFVAHKNYRLSGRR